MTTAAPTAAHVLNNNTVGWIHVVWIHVVWIHVVF